MEVGISLKRKRWKMKCIQIIELVRSTEESVEVVKNISHRLLMKQNLSELLFVKIGIKQVW